MMPWRETEREREREIKKEKEREKKREREIKQTSPENLGSLMLSSLIRH